MSTRSARGATLTLRFAKHLDLWRPGSAPWSSVYKNFTSSQGIQDLPLLRRRELDSGLSYWQELAAGWQTLAPSRPYLFFAQRPMANHESTTSCLLLPLPTHVAYAAS